MLLVGLLLAWLSIRNAAQALLATVHPAYAEAFWPASGDALAGDAHARIVLAGGRVDDTARGLIRRALVRAPDADAPLVLAGFAASEDGDLGRASALMTAAVARNPRNDAARYWLLDHDIRTGRYAAGLAQVGPALRLREGTRDSIFALVAGLLDIPAAAPAVRAALATSPDWRADFFRVRAAAGTDPATLAALLRALPLADAETARIERRAVLYAAIDRGRFALAHDLWLALLPAGQRPTTAIYDPDFSGLPGAPPFAWNLQPPEGASAKMIGIGGAEPRTALAMTYPGSAPALIAEQYAMIAPGPHRLSLQSRRIGEADGADGADGAEVVARVRCANDDAILAELSLADRPAWTRRSIPVSAPSGCGAVRVQFAGMPGAQLSVARVQVTAVRLEPR